MLKIGDFSKLSRISIRMLRYYEKHNLLKPCHVDEESGYRFYAHEQIFEAAKIRFLKEAGFSVAMMEEIMRQYDSPKQIQRYFQIRRKELEEERQKISNTLIRLERAQLLLNKEDTFMDYTVEVKQIRGVYAATLRTVIPAYEREDLVWKRMYSIFAEKHLNVTFAQPQHARAYFYDEGFKEKDVDVEIAIEVVGSYEDVEDIRFRQLKDEAVASVTFTGDYSQISEVCMAITMWIKENGYELDGANFCIYHKGWGQCDNPEEFVTEICFPIRK
ncbi:MerR family transcriptional regulator [[Clostridium] innocuum]|nr:MerR family transcriptional regulator [[Clostridium] innocuum]MCR0265765.1 MerR family transcriptional regulator [[Clostridium] innocuum]